MPTLNLNNKEIQLLIEALHRENYSEMLIRLSTADRKILQQLENTLSKIVVHPKVIGNNYNSLVFEDSPIRSLDFTARTLNALKSDNINTAKELAACNKNRLLQIYGLGKKSWAEIINVLDICNIQHKCREKI